MQRGRPLNRILDYWVGTPLLNLLATFRRRRQPPRNVTHVGLLCSPALGDTLLFSAALQDVRLAYPDARLTHICTGQNLAAAEVIAGADDRLLIDLTRPLATLRLLRAQAFDVLLDFTSWQRLTAFYTMLAGSSYTVGFQTAGQHRSRAYDRTVLHRNDRHELANLHSLAASSGLDKAASAQQPCLAGWSGSHPYLHMPDVVVFHPWASGQRSWLREWPAERWIALATRLRKASTLFLITGGPADRARAEALVASLVAAGMNAEAFISPDGLRTLTLVLRDAALVVSVNTGVMHLAAIAGAPTIGLSGPTSNVRWGPVGPQAIGLQASGNDCGCLNLGFEFDRNAEDCMERIGVEEVVDAAGKLRREAL